MNFLCIIPARANSKRLINKNIKKINNQPLIYWSLNFASQIKEFKKIILTTDSDKIINCSKEFKNIFSLKRPKNLSNSKTSMIDVVNHVLKKESQIYDAVVILQPTSPLRKINTILKALKIFKTNKYDSLVTVCKINNKSIPKNLILSSKNGIVNNLKFDHKPYNDIYYKLDGGVVFITKIKQIKKSIIGGVTKLLEVDFPEAIDIDTEYDFKVAKFFMEQDNEKY